MQYECRDKTGARRRVPCSTSVSCASLQRATNLSGLINRVIFLFTSSIFCQENLGFDLQIALNTYSLSIVLTNISVFYLIYLYTYIYFFFIFVNLIYTGCPSNYDIIGKGMILYEKIIIKSAEFAICKNILHSLRLIMIMITGILISIILFNNFIEICQTVLCAFILQNTYRTYKTIGKTQNCVR